MFANLFGSKEATTKSTPSNNVHTALPLTGVDPIPPGTTLEQVRLTFVVLMGQENLNHHRMGQLYNYVVDSALAEKAGYKDAKAFFSKHLVDLSQTSLSLYGAVARVFSAQVSRRFGVTCLYLLLSYAEATDMEVNPAEPGNHPIEVPDDKGLLSTLSFGSCSVDQMRRAIQRKRRPTSSKPVPAEAEALAAQYREAVKSRFTQGSRIKVQVRNEKGKAVLDFKGIPVEQVNQLVTALTEPLPPAPTLPPELAAPPVPPVEDGAMG
jgi:hypothetical protein